MSVLDPLLILRTIAEHGVDAVVIGQAAAVIHGHPETTVDVDLLTSLEIDNAERLASALRALGAHHTANAAQPDEHDFVGLRQVLSFETAAGRVDVLPAASGLGAYDDVAPRAVSVDLGGFTVLVATLDDVIASKEAAGRPKDLRRLDSLRALRRLLAEQRRRGS
ncbi:MAG TPA: nucleotidyltransferase [Mycobacteriales bacterium]|nr:nucleotidyltransferase [Mycobacteriales bacterium]